MVLALLSVPNRCYCRLPLMICRERQHMLEAQGWFLCLPTVGPREPAAGRHRPGHVHRQAQPRLADDVHHPQPHWDGRRLRAHFPAVRLSRPPQDMVLPLASSCSDVDTEHCPAAVDQTGHVLTCGSVTWRRFSPNIQQIVVLDSKRVRRAKLYYLRDRQPKEYRVATKT